MTEESAKGKLTLKKTLTLKNVVKPSPSDGKKMVQVEVRKKRTINPTPQVAAPKEIDEATAFDNFMNAKQAVEFGICDEIKDVI